MKSPAVAGLDIASLEYLMDDSGGLLHFAGLEAARANAHPPGRAVDLGPHALQVRIEPAQSEVVRMADVMADARLLSANVTNSTHDFPLTKAL